MSKFISFFFSLIRWVILLLTLLWLYVALNRLSLLAIPLGLLILSFYNLRWEVKTLFSKINLPYKQILFCLMILFQLALLFSTKLIIRSDAAVIFQGAFGLIDANRIANYLTVNPNNLFLFLYERTFYLIFGQAGIWVMQLLNIVYLDLTGVLLYRTAQKHLNQRAANFTFALYLGLMALTPQFLAMYTDVMILPILAGQIYFSLEILKNQLIGRRLRRSCLLLGLLTGLGYFVRPTNLVISFSLLILSFFQGKRVKLRNLLLHFSLGLVLVLTLGQAILHFQKQVEYQAGRGKTALAFIDLGLTPNGTDQADFQAGLQKFVSSETQVDSSYDGRYSNAVVWQDIKRRLDAYTPATFLSHLWLKFDLTMRDGSLGWNYKDVSQEIDYYINPLAEISETQGWIQFLRYYFINIDEANFLIFKQWLQVCFVLMIIGLLGAIFFQQNLAYQHFLALSIFGGILFLMIFEGGKSRYLIQFLPQMLVFSGLGWDEIMRQSLKIRKYGIMNLFRKGEHQ